MLKAEEVAVVEEVGDMRIPYWVFEPRFLMGMLIGATFGSAIMGALPKIIQTVNSFIQNI